jgi:hypothetical protein
LPDNYSHERQRAYQAAAEACQGAWALFQLDAARSKGSHVTLYLGDKLTIVLNPKDELKTGTFHGMLKQLGIDSEEL